MMRCIPLAFALLASAASAAPAPPSLPTAWSMTRIEAPAEPGAIPLYRGTPPGQAGNVTERWARMGDGMRTVRNVTRPTLTPVLPDPAKATGAAVIVLPGGGFKMLSMDVEGWPVARWLADHGIAAFVLKYRLNETPESEADFMRVMGETFAAAARNGGGMATSEPRATADALQALKFVRAGAAGWNVDPARIGMIGFSAGARTTLNAIVTGKADERAAFVGYIYGPMLPVAVPADAPPMFAALASDDGLVGGRGFGLIEGWQKARRPVELHMYERGEHGFGLGRPGTTSTLVMDEFRLWLQTRGLLGASK